MVIPGWEAVFVLGLITTWLQGWPLLGFFQGANSNWLLVAVLLFLSQIPLIIFVFLPRGKIFVQALDRAVAQGLVTSELTNAFKDKTVYASHIYEYFPLAHELAGEESYVLQFLFDRQTFL